MAAPKFQPQRAKPRSASPVIRDLFDDMRARKIPIVEIAEEMRMTRTGLAYWKYGRGDPAITKVEALAQVLGYRLVLVPLVGNGD